MFHPDRWVNAFIIVTEKNSINSADSYNSLKALALPVKNMQRSLFGYSDAKKLESLMRENIIINNDRGVSALEVALRFICLLVEKSCFQYIDLILNKLEEWMENKLLMPKVTLDCVLELDSDFEKELKETIVKKIGAQDVKMKINIMPELMGGYRLHIGASCIDASLKGQLEKLSAYLSGEV